VPPAGLTIALWSVAATAALGAATLVPSDWVPRTGLGWQYEHFFAYCIAAACLSTVSPRPSAVAICLALLAVALEGLQGLTPDRDPDVTAALLSSIGAISGAALAMFFSRVKLSLLAARTACAGQALVLDG
jgi:VanZ family protein